MPNTKVIRILLFLGGGLVALGMTGLFVIIGLEFLKGGAGVQLGLAAVSGFGVLIGMAGVMGFVLAAFFCFAVGVVLMANAVVSRDGEQQR